MKTIIKSTIAALAAVITMTSCYRILEQTPTDRYSDAVVWDDEYLLNAHLAELYACTPVMVNDAICIYPNGGKSLANYDNNEWAYVMGFSAQMEGPVRTIEITDEAKYNFGAQGHLLGVKDNGIQANGAELQWWGNAYYTIRNLNNFISEAASSPIENVEHRIAEARFLRAFNYFAMVKRYGGVPLVTTAASLDDSDDVIYPKRSTEKEVYDFILKETLEISDILSSAPEKGRASKWAALALRSRAALYAASVAQFGTVQMEGLLGIPASEADAYYRICYDASKKIIDEGPFELYDKDADKTQNFKNLFLDKSNNNKEAIMVSQHTGSGSTAGGDNLWSWDMAECPRPNVWGVGNYHGPYLEMVEEFELKDAGTGAASPLTRGELVNGYTKTAYTVDELWGDRDPRLAATVWTTGTEWPKAVGGVLGDNRINMQLGIWTRENTVLDGRNDTYEGMAVIGDQVVRFKETETPNTGFGVMKYLDPNANNMNWFCESTTDYQIFRLGEIVLNYAEAAFELGETGEALSAVNDIRDRAGIKALASVNRDQIRHERKVELAFENHRYWDLRRWRIAHQVLTRTEGDPQYGLYTGIRYIYDVVASEAANEPKFRLYFEENIDRRPSTPTFPEKNYYFPIGQGRIASNPNLVENPLYD